MSGKIGTAFFSLNTGYSLDLLDAGLLIIIGGGVHLLIGSVLYCGVQFQLCILDVFLFLAKFSLALLF